jgi:hypothetical protein
MNRTMIWVAAATALAALVGCGDDAEQQTKRAMGAAVTPKPPSKANQPPVIHHVAFAPRSVVPGQKVQAQVDASDPDGDAVRVQYAWIVNRRPVGANRPMLDTTGFGKDDRIELEVVATDGTDQSEVYRRSLRVGNTAPVIHGVSFDPHEGIRPGVPVTALVDVGDADQDSLRLEYTWIVNGRETRQREKVFDTTRFKRGDELKLRVLAHDGDDASDPVETPVVVLENSPPEIQGIPKPEQLADGTFLYRFEAKDPDGDRGLRWSLTEAPAGMTIDPITGEARWKPSAEQAGEQAIEVTVMDRAKDGSSLRFGVKVTATTEPAGEAQPPAAPAGGN